MYVLRVIVFSIIWKMKGNDKYNLAKLTWLTYISLLQIYFIVCCKSHLNRFSNMKMWSLVMKIFCFRLGESEGSYCTLATFPSDSSSESSSSTPSPSPPVTPLQEKPRKVQKPTHQRYNSLDYTNKYRNHSNMAVSSLRVKPSPREVSTCINYKVLYTAPYTITHLVYR